MYLLIVFLQKAEKQTDMKTFYRLVNSQREAAAWVGPCWDWEQESQVFHVSGARGFSHTWTRVLTTDLDIVPILIDVNNEGGTCRKYILEIPVIKNKTKAR